MVQPIHSGQRRFNIGADSDDCDGDNDDDGEYRGFMYG